MDADDVRDYWGLTTYDGNDLKMMPSDSHITSFIASAQDDIEVYTNYTFDEGNKKHYRLIMLYVMRKIIMFCRAKQGFAIVSTGSFSSQLPDLRELNEEIRHLEYLLW